MVVLVVMEKQKVIWVEEMGRMVVLDGLVGLV